ncbi:malate dehydrogenase, putative, partial [Perkinsus marinus ATCC 50983]
NAVTEVVDALAGAGSATLSMAYAANRFAHILIQGMKGKPAKAAAYINEPYEGIDYFAHYCDFGPEGVSKIHKLDLSPFEKSRLPETIDKLRHDIHRGLEFMRRPSQIILQ